MISGFTLWWMRRVVSALAIAGLLATGCTPAEACEDIAGDTAHALAEYAEISRPGDGMGEPEPEPSLTPQEKRVIPVLAGARERFEAAGCSDERVHSCCGSGLA